VGPTALLLARELPRGGASSSVLELVDLETAAVISLGKLAAPGIALAGGSRSSGHLVALRSGVVHVVDVRSPALADVATRLPLRPSVLRRSVLDDAVALVGDIGEDLRLIDLRAGERRPLVAFGGYRGKLASPDLPAALTESSLDWLECEGGRERWIAHAVGGVTTVWDDAHACPQVQLSSGADTVAWVPHGDARAGFALAGSAVHSGVGGVAGGGAPSVRSLAWVP